jgi:flavin-dependent dehydrogenase
MGSGIHVFLPKRNISSLGRSPQGRPHHHQYRRKKVDANLMDDFLTLPEVRSFLPNLQNALRDRPGEFAYHKGRFPCGLAQRYAGDRFVLVGDAAGLVRAFKGKGITSAIQTGMRAAEVILR